jgi:23S rRNA (uracil1939-C5)-methyltransferase
MQRKRHSGGRVLEGHVRDVTDSGDSVIETEAGIVMVSGALPGEQVRVRVESTRGGVARGSVEAWLSRSPERIEPSCGIAERCGGCPLMSLSLDAQRKLKLERVQRAVAKVALPDVHAELDPGESPLGYRRRARLHFRKVGSGVVLGYHAHHARQLVDVERCLVLEPVLQSALERVRIALAPALSGAGEIELSSLDAARVAVSVRADAAQPPEAYRAVEALAAQAPISFSALHVGDGAAAAFGERHESRARDGLPWLAPHGGFAQVNAAVNERLRAHVNALAEPEGARVLELYAGHGNFTLSLSERASALVAVEGDAAAADACRENLRARQRSNTRVLASDVRKLKLNERSDVIVLDPPRGGCPELASIAAQARPERVVYVSCHMTTLSRDLRALHEAGYAADRVYALDMFPQTGHVEAVVRMRKSRAS